MILGISSIIVFKLKDKWRKQEIKSKYSYSISEKSNQPNISIYIDKYIFAIFFYMYGLNNFLHTTYILFKSEMLQTIAIEEI